MNKVNVRHVALLIETSGAFGRGLMGGIARFNREQGNWFTYFQPRGLGATPPTWFKHWKGDGILVRVDSPEAAELVANAKVPVVNLRRVFSGVKPPYVGSDSLAVASMATRHLLDRGLRNFGFCGRQNRSHPGFNARGDAFINAINKAGYDCSEFESDGPDFGTDWEQELKRIARWISILPKPAGIFAANDEKGLQVLEACRRSGVMVPEDIAVIGVDNDPALCDLAIPPLSSIDPNSEKIGYEAASLLNRMMEGHSPVDEVTLIAPVGVHVRRSTDVLACEDIDVRKALGFIHHAAMGRIKVADVDAHVGIARSILQEKIRRYTGRTIYQLVEEARINRARELLLMPSLNIKQVALKSGFTSTQYFTRVFKIGTGETPAQYRKNRPRT